MQSILDKHKARDSKNQAAQEPEPSSWKPSPINIEENNDDDDNKMDMTPTVISDTEEPDSKKSKHDSCIAPALSLSEAPAADIPTTVYNKLDKTEHDNEDTGIAMDVDQVDILPLPVAQSQKSRPSSALSTSNSGASSLKAYSTSGDNTPIESEAGEDTEPQTPVTPLLTPPKIVITDFSFDEPKNVEDEDPFKGVTQTNTVSIVSCLCSYNLFVSMFILCSRIIMMQHPGKCRIPDLSHGPCLELGPIT